ncbi:HTH domain-containing protein [Actinobacillus equuli subsp. haemolyticus]|uniref:helix-turn-helix domain-containing protein n=1 Tax=Actinobacillus equuli TaxID=718 RepID=UPI00244669E2|nr:helix-turn-helix domain-containing protein [Actinobacillus equuli]WGE50207.1 HTH domain-containing protein [Actinobacillus equuli subsp. haemolyticus]
MIKHWKKCPSDWINQGVFEKLKFSSSNLGKTNASNISALLVLLALIMLAKEDKDTGKQMVSVTYDDLMEDLNISRASISSGIKKLSELGIITIDKSNRTNVYILETVRPESGWCKVPILKSKSGSRCIDAIANFSLRSKFELYSLKLFFYLAARRHNSESYTQVSYDKIEEITKIPRNDIKKHYHLCK